MTKDEFMYDYSLEYIVYMINRYIEDNYTTNDSEEVIEVTNASNVLQEVKMANYMDKVGVVLTAEGVGSFTSAIKQGENALRQLQAEARRLLPKRRLRLTSYF